MEADEYLSLKSRSEGLFKSKGSKHFGYACPVTSKDDVKRFIEELKIEHHSARHFCFAYRLGFNGDRYRLSDDGEPNNSAGPPILGVLKSYNLTYSLIVVVRYFGGTKLGVGGLIEAYREAGVAAIENGTIIKCFRSRKYKVIYPYSRMGDVMNVLKRASISPENTDFQLECSLEITLRESVANSIAKSLSGISEVELTILSED